MQAEFWHNCWQQQRIGFHQQYVHPLLPVVFSQSGWQGDTAIFVPLCGKSLDLWWLAQHGKVIGAELSDLACQQFYLQQQQNYQIESYPLFQRFCHDAVELWQGDYFALRSEQLAPIGLIYDRAALIALPEDMRADYVQQLKRLCPGPVCLLLFSLEYPSQQLSGPPFSVSEHHVKTLFDFADTVQLIAVRDLTGRPFAQRQFQVSRLVEKVYMIRW